VNIQKFMEHGKRSLVLWLGTREQVLATARPTSEPKLAVPS